MSDQLNLAEIKARAERARQASDLLRSDFRWAELNFDVASRILLPALAADVLALLADRLAMQLEAAQAALRDAIASSTANGEERDAAVADLATARGLLMDCWHQLDGDVYVLPGGEVHPGAATTIHALHAFLWPEGKTI